MYIKAAKTYIVKILFLVDKFTFILSQHNFKIIPKQLSDDYWNATPWYEKSDLSDTSSESRKSCDYWTTKLQVGRGKVKNKCCSQTTCGGGTSCGGNTCGGTSCCGTCCCSDDPSSDLLSVCQDHVRFADQHHHKHHGGGGGNHGKKGGGKKGGSKSKKGGAKGGGKSSKKGGGGSKKKGHRGHHGGCTEGSSEDRLVGIPRDNNQCNQSCCNQQQASCTSSFQRRYARSFQCTNSWPKCYDGPNCRPGPEKTFYTKPMTAHTQHKGACHPGCRPKVSKGSEAMETVGGEEVRGKVGRKENDEQKAGEESRKSKRSGSKTSKKKRVKNEIEENVYCDAINGLMGSLSID